jgi:hypothetical protein
MDILPADPTYSFQWNTAADCDAGLRIAIVSTPRTGNTWLRRMLGSVYSLPQIIEDDPRGIEWQRLPERCILQHHWDADPELIAQLNEHRFHLVTVSRHPLDVLISILHFASVNPGTTAYWFGKRGGSEAGIANATPRSPAFLEYAASPRAKLLLSISPSWAAVKDCLVVRYESLVQDPIRQLSLVCDALRPAPVEAVQYVAHANTLEKQRSLVANQHFWQGQPNLWKQLLTARTAIRMAEDHKPFFETFGYGCDPDSNLTDQDADANWYALEFASLKEECRLARSQVLKVQELHVSDIARLRSQIVELRAALGLPAEGEGAVSYTLALLHVTGKARRLTGRLLGGLQKMLRLGGRAVESRDHNE